MSMCIMVMYIALVWTRIKDFIIFQWRSTDIVKHFAMIIICRRLYNIPLPVFYIYRFRLCLENNFHSLVPRYRYWDNIRHNIIIWYTACRSRFRMFFFIHRVLFFFRCRFREQTLKSNNRSVLQTILYRFSRIYEAQT